MSFSTPPTTSRVLVCPDAPVKRAMHVSRTLIITRDAIRKLIFTGPEFGQYTFPEQAGLSQPQLTINQLVDEIMGFIE